MRQSVGRAQRLQHRRHGVGVVEALHQCIDGSHHSVGVLSELDTLPHLLWLLEVLEVLEKLLGGGELHKQPAKKKKTAW